MLCFEESLKDFKDIEKITVVAFLKYQLFVFLKLSVDFEKLSKYSIKFI